MTLTKTQVAAYIKIHAAVAETIRDLGHIPSGHLYAQLVGHMTLEQYQRIIDRLKGAGLVKESNYLLTWVEPIQPPDEGPNYQDFNPGQDCFPEDMIDETFSRR